LDYTTPNIILQENSYDCGFAAVANAMGFVLGMRNVPFTYSDIELYDSCEPPSSKIGKQKRVGMMGGYKKSPSYVMKHRMHSLKPFWHKLMTDADSKYGNCSNSSDVLMYM
jgi:hypothetical protein